MRKLSRVEKKMKRRRMLFRILLLAALILTMFTLALNTDIFIIDNIKVLGNNKVSKDIIINSSSISLGENIFKISTRNGKKNIENLAYVKEAEIIRKFPKGILIEIIERKEIIQTKEISSYFLIDIYGYILDIVDVQNDKLPLLFGLNIDNKKTGDNVFQQIEEDRKKEFILECESIKILYKMQEIDMVDNNNINILLNDGISVAFGTLDDVKYKLNLLHEILIDIEKKQISCKMILMNKGDNPIIVLNED